MGMNSENALMTGRSWMVFDIETCPMPGCQQYLTDQIEAPSTYKDAAKIAAYIAEKQAKHVAEAGLDVDLCEVVAIAGAFHDTDWCQTRETTSEADMLDGFWRFVATIQREHGNLVGFNCLGFDLPILLRRSLYLDVPTPKVKIDKYRHDGVIDLLDVLTFQWRMRMRSLAFYSRRFGIPHDDAVKGEHVAGLVAAGDWATVAAHVRSDVASTKALAQRIGLIHQPKGVTMDAKYYSGSDERDFAPEPDDCPVCGAGEDEPCTPECDCAHCLRERELAESSPF
jgi:predicted PolB exonuclease-like 3'-5' exonuclease